ncbi:hypothetical protein [Acrocarpospora sp. B8E8]|uniref:hypothetical protein n=1 Tax=Acrocarpospora sp. B8E8 TaxID=3153572 RepID=UPI00325F39D4
MGIERIQIKAWAEHALERTEVASDSLLAIHAHALSALLDRTRADTKEDRPAGLHPITRLLHHEIHYWRKTARAYELREPSEWRVAEVVCAATLFGGHGAEAQRRTLRALPVFDGEPGHVIDGYLRWVTALYPGSDVLAPVALRPDRMGEEHVAQALAQRPGLIARIAPLLEGYQVQRSLSVLARTLPRHPYIIHEISALLRTDPEQFLPTAILVANKQESPWLMSEAISDALIAHNDLGLVGRIRLLFGESRFGPLADAERALDSRRDPDETDDLELFRPSSVDSPFCYAVASGCLSALRCVADGEFADALRILEALRAAIRRERLDFGSLPPASKEVQIWNTVISDRPMHDAYQSGDIGMRRELARVLTMSCDCWLVLGHPERAFARVQDAIGIQRELVRLHPLGESGQVTPTGAIGIAAAEGAGWIARRFALDLADSYSSLAAVYRRTGQPDLAGRFHAESISLREAVMAVPVELECTIGTAMAGLIRRPCHLLQVILQEAYSFTVTSSTTRACGTTAF